MNVGGRKDYRCLEVKAVVGELCTVALVTGGVPCYCDETGLGFWAYLGFEYSQPLAVCVEAWGRGHDYVVPPEVVGAIGCANDEIGALVCDVGGLAILEEDCLLELRFQIHGVLLM